jgi:hypothetical protein|tara:strand:+ start:83 stop:373 length:291 start_codon:yes stop_codon:yes gene_type:complete
MVKKTLSKKQLDSLAKGREIRANNIRLKNSSINQSGGDQRLIGISNAIASLVKLNLPPSRVQNELQPIIWNAMKNVHSGNLNGAYGLLSNAALRFR